LPCAGVSTQRQATAAAGGAAHGVVAEPTAHATLGGERGIAWAQQW